MARNYKQIGGFNSPVLIKHEPNYQLFDETSEWHTHDTRSNVYILHAPNHWVTFTDMDFVNGKIEEASSWWVLYDSRFLESTLLELIPQLNNMLHQDQGCELSKTKNTWDCGLFAIAFGESLCQSEDPSLCEYFQSMLRSNFNTYVTRDIGCNWPSRPRTPSNDRFYVVDLVNCTLESRPTRWTYLTLLF